VGSVVDDRSLVVDEASGGAGTVVENPLIPITPRQILTSGTVAFLL